MSALLFLQEFLQAKNKKQKTKIINCYEKRKEEGKKRAEKTQTYVNKVSLVILMDLCIFLLVFQFYFALLILKYAHRYPKRNEIEKMPP